MRLEEFIADMRIDEFMGEMTPDDLPEPYNQMAKLIGIENTVKIINNFGGFKIYFPREKLSLKGFGTSESSKNTTDTMRESWLGNTASQKIG
ncbi:hypothetical protein ADA01nite_35840 [Aneurinibacillus danicus]|uniref:Uncharacterized protein n=1 Tax=Aneurinibacillus danicus TaxID=267746 RepID=A0A511VBB0_9BACL|nr:hypothetical protein [Aneurinibacillus danicus]GEN36124.1 hypothetical protein ADA01nite_35840 [Aneurinibacillus danicus]